MEKRFTSDFKNMVGLTIWNSFGFFFLDFLIPFVASTEIDASGTEMGIIFSVRTIGYFVIAPIVGGLADSKSKKLLIMIGSIGRAIAYILLYLSIILSSLGGIIAGNFMLGFFAGFFWIPMDVLLSEKSSKEHRSRAFGMMHSKIGQGTLIGAFIGFGIMGLSAEYYPGNLYLLYFGLVLFGLGNLYAGIKFYLTVNEDLVFDSEEKVNNKINSKVGYREFIKSLPKKMVLGLFLVLFALTLSTTNSEIAKPFILVYLTQQVESDPTLAAMAYIPAGVTSMLLAPKLGGIADRLPPKLVIAVGASTGALTTWLLINTTTLWLFSFLLVIDMTIAITTGLVIQGIMSRISISHRGKVFGLQTFFMDLGSIIGPIFGGFLWDRYDYRAPFLFSISVELLLIPFYIFAIIKITPYLAEKKSEKSIPQIEIQKDQIHPTIPE